MALITPEVDINKAALRDQYLAIREQLQVIQDTMQASPTPAQAYASIDYLASSMDKMLVILKKIVT